MQDAAQTPTAATTAADAAADAFIARWQGVTASELSTSQSFLIDLCRLLDVEVPHPTPEQDYMFERPITFRHGDGGTSAGRIDLYRRGAFVLESKKVRLGSHTKGFDDALLRARSQAEAYARALPADEGRPPFVVVVDVGQRIELYSEFSRSGGTYVPFPDPRSHRIALADLRRPELRERLRRVWTDPLGLDPSRESARVTRQIADRLATLARSLEQGGFDAEAVAQFLMRCLFTMFAEDVKLLPAHSFRDLLARHAEQPDVAMRMLAQLWRDMDAGGFSAVLAGNVLRFNGKLFKQPDTLPLDAAQIALLLDAARADWKHVEPAIFGTLLERALSLRDRHKLGAHYTPRAYVERLVLPTVIEPLRREWSDAQAAAGTLADEGKADDAIAELKRFHHRLCTVRVLDPACGSGNFLYVTLEHLKRLEGEVLNALDELGDRQTGLALGGERADAMAGETVDPHNLLGIELNPRAAAIAEVVLWIGYLQWHYRTRGDVHPPQPVIRDFRNIENRDAVLAHDGVEFVTDERGVPVTRWDGETMKVSPVTGELVPDEAARRPVERYLNPRKAAWPEADFVVGNPPFIGKRNVRSALGEGYLDALRAAWKDVPDSADFVMHWRQNASRLVRNGRVQRFGFITTNSISQAFNRRVLNAALGDKKAPLVLQFAIPDHPWVDSADGAAVRIAMTVGALDKSGSVLRRVVAEYEAKEEVGVDLREVHGVIHADLSVGANVAGVKKLVANQVLSQVGIFPYGGGFVIEPEAARSLSRDLQPELASKLIREYRNGKDLTDKPRGVFVVDTNGFSEAGLRTAAPSVWQWLYERVKPERDQNRDPHLSTNWWLHARSRPDFRASVVGLPRYIATAMTAKHRLFQFIDAAILPDQKIIAIGIDDALYMGVLSSIVHGTWAVAAGSRLGVGNDPVYVKSRCFESFPFPDFKAAGKSAGSIRVALVGDDDLCKIDTWSKYPSDRIRELGERLDVHRKRQQAAHPALTLTGMYNVLDKLRSGEVLTAKERTIHEQGLVSVLRQLHDELDEAVLYAYNWGDLLPLLRVAHGNESPDTLQQLAEAQRDLRPTELHVDGGPASTREEAKRAFDEAILERLVALNAERAAEEARGHIRWLRPEFQNPEVAREKAPEQARFTSDGDAGEAAEKIDETSVALALKPLPWPKDTVDQVRAVAELLAASPVPLSIDEIATRFTARGPWKKRLPKLVEMLVALGRAQEQEGGYVAG